MAVRRFCTSLCIQSVAPPGNRTCTTSHISGSMHTLFLRAPAAAVVFPGQQQPLSATSHVVPRHTLCRSSRLVCTASKGFGGKAAVNQVGVQKKDECPCGSGQAFTQCCGQYHAGAVEPNAEAVLRTCPQLLLRRSAASLERLNAKCVVDLESVDRALTLFTHCRREIYCICVGW